MGNHMGILFDARCEECGSLHTFFEPTVDVVEEGAVYEFTCPTTQEPARVSCSSFGECTEIQPEEAVLISKMAP